MGSHSSVAGGDGHDNSINAQLDVIKAVVGSEVGYSDEDLKTLVTLLAFQVLVPSAIKLVSYLLNTADTYFYQNDNEILGENIFDTTAIVHSLTLVEDIQNTINAEV